MYNPDTQAPSTSIPLYLGVSMVLPPESHLSITLNTKLSILLGTIPTILLLPTSTVLPRDRQLEWAWVSNQLQALYPLPTIPYYTLLHPSILVWVSYSRIGGSVGYVCSRYIDGWQDSVSDHIPVPILYTYTPYYQYRYPQYSYIPIYTGITTQDRIVYPSINRELQYRNVGEYSGYRC